MCPKVAVSPQVGAKGDDTHHFLGTQFQQLRRLHKRWSSKRLTKCAKYNFAATWSFVKAQKICDVVRTYRPRARFFAVYRRIGDREQRDGTVFGGFKLDMDRFWPWIQVRKSQIWIHDVSLKCILIHSTSARSAFIPLDKACEACKAANQNIFLFRVINFTWVCGVVVLLANMIGLFCTYGGVFSGMIFYSIFIIFVLLVITIGGSYVDRYEDHIRRDVKNNFKNLWVIGSIDNLFNTNGIERSFGCCGWNNAFDYCSGRLI